MAENPKLTVTTDDSVEAARLKYGTVIIGGAFVLLAGVVALSVATFTEADEVTAVVGSVTGIVGTVIGAFFGVQAGSAGKDAVQATAETAVKSANDQATTAQQKLEVVLGMSPSNIIKQVETQYPDLFGSR